MLTPLLMLLATMPPQAAPEAGDRQPGHLPYADVGAAALVAAPAGFAVGQPCRVQPPVATALGELIAAQASSGVTGSLRGVSCYRSVAHQRSVFCRIGRRCSVTGKRARLVAPPGYSEHETGYAIDYGVRPEAGCGDTRDCIAATPAGRWLIANAARFGFEMSFPAGNAQGIGWEPWHWRWVGVDGEDPAAQAARTVFAAARLRYPAFPAVPPLVVRVAEQPPLPVIAIPVPPPPAAIAIAPKRRYGLFGRR